MKTYYSLKQIQKDLYQNEVSCIQLVKNYLKNIQAHNSLNAFLEIFEEEALEKAQQVDKKIKENTAGKLAGMIIGIKDVLCYKDHHLQASSKILDNFISQFNGTAIERLIEEDAIIIGRINCDEFAMGSSNENSAFGPTKNGLDPTRVPGGSSGGSAVAVQMDMCLTALGSDTGGSVRQPAAFCDVIGLKPTYSRISRHGLIAYASSFDCIGIFAKNIEDIAITLQIIAGKDNYDSTVSSKDVPQYINKLQFDKKAKIAYFPETLEAEGLSPIIKERTKQTLNFLKDENHTVDPVNFPYLEYILPTYYILSTAEASANLARFDGVKYGFRTTNYNDLESMYKKTRSEGFGEEVKRRILLGTFVLSASYYDAYYTKAQKVRNLIKEKTQEVLQQYDFIMLPTTPTTAFKLGEHAKNPLEMYLADLYTVQASISGIPAISIPNGYDEDKLPIGLQIMTSNFDEAKLLAFSQYILENNK